MNTPPNYAFLSELARIINAGQSRSVLLAGNVHDLFFAKRGDGSGGEYLPLVPALCRRYDVEGVVQIVYELNGPVRFVDDRDRETVRRAWITWKSGEDFDKLVVRALNDSKAKAQREAYEQAFDRQFNEAIGKPTVALELLRQLALCSRDQARPRRFRLLIIIEAADLMLPAGDGDITRLSAADRHRVSICQDWFGDPGFMNGEDSVVMLAESRSLVHPRVAGLPQVLTVDVPAPDEATRLHYVKQFGREQPKRTTSGQDRAEGALSDESLARMAAGLSIHALRQMLIGATYAGEALTAEAVMQRVEAFIIAQLGEDVVEFAKPGHRLDDVVGYTALKAFLREEMIPRIKSSGPAALPGAAVAGPIGAGKTFIFEAVAGELGLPVLTLKNIRSQYFGQTDVVFERLRRVLESLDKVVIFVDEADTQFGSVGGDTHATERRLTGKIQQMMSDPKLRGKVTWLLMTARIHRLSPDIRRPGRVGDLIIPVLDPEGDDRLAFVRWVLEAVMDDVDDEAVARVDEVTRGHSAAGFASLRSQLKARAAMSKEQGRVMALEDVEDAVRDQLPADIGPTRRYQTLQALLNCTRRSLLPDANVDDAMRLAWQREMRELEAMGIE